jgi:hypothetical protein
MARQAVAQMPRLALLVAAAQVGNGGMTDWRIQRAQLRPLHTPTRLIAI